MSGAGGRAAETSGAWGVLGGTFDPIHFAHLAIAEWVRETLDLAGVLFVPAGQPPHKPGQPISPAADRAAMVAAAVADNPWFRLSRLELERPGASYTVDTAEQLLARPPQPWDPARGLIFILSAEAAAGLPAWHEPQRLLTLSRLAVVPRHGYAMPDAAWLRRSVPGQEDRVLLLGGPDLGHSASLIRRLAGAGRSLRYLVPPAVAAYIREHGLYAPLPSPAAAMAGDAG